MSRDSDEHDEMTIHVGGLGTSLTGDQDDVARFLGELRALGEGEPPAPSPELAALLGGASLLRARRPSYRIAARGGLVAAAVVAALVIAAANHDLPQPAQRVVSNVVNDLTPFEIAPRKHVAPTPTPSPTPTLRRPRPAVAPSEDGSSAPGGEDRSRSEDGSGGAGSDDGAGAGGGGSDGGPSSAPRSSSEDDGGASSAPSGGGGGGGGGGEREPGDG